MRIHMNRLKALARVDAAIRDLRNDDDVTHVRVEVFNGKSDELMGVYDTRNSKGYWEVTDAS
jgi:ABC-type transporter MlaC component